MAVGDAQYDAINFGFMNDKLVILILALRTNSGFVSNLDIELWLRDNSLVENSGFHFRFNCECILFIMI